MGTGQCRGAIEDATVAGFAEVPIESINDVVDLPDEHALAEITVEATSRVNYSVSKSEAYAWDEEEWASLSEWNE